MANVTIQIPDDLQRSLERIASENRQTVQELVLKYVRMVAEIGLESRIGSPVAVLAAMREPPHVAASDAEAFEAALRSGRVPVQAGDLFSG
jgi:hypothetical protein